MEISEQRERELLELLLEEIAKRSDQKVHCTYPPCSCGNTSYSSFEREILKGWAVKGIVVRVGVCGRCGTRVYPRVDLVQ